MNSKQIFTLAFFLAFICAIASAVLAVVNKATESDIQKMKAKKTADALKIVLGEFDNNPINEKILIIHENREVIFYPAKKGNKLLSFAVSTFSPKGYGGKLSIMAQIYPSGEIGTVIVTEQNETPGLGTIATNRTKTKKISDIFSKNTDHSLPPNQVLDSFKGKDCTSAPWKLKKDGGEIDSITGATISSLAITDAVNHAAITFNVNKEKLIQGFSFSEVHQ